MSVSTLPASGSPPHHGWEPNEIGMTRATAVSFLIVALILAAMLTFVGEQTAPPPPPPMQVKMVTLPPPTPLQSVPPPPVPPPPVPEVQPPPPPPLAFKVPDYAPPSHIAAPKPPPVKPKHISRTAPPVETPPPEVTSTQPPAPHPPPAAPVQDNSGIGPYRAGLHNAIQSHVEIGPQLQAINASGTAVIEAVVEPSGNVTSARVLRSSGNGLIDKAALAAVRATVYPFRGHMPTTPITITVPIEISADSSG